MVLTHSERDPLALSLLLALVVHAVVILGVSFNPLDEEARRRMPPTLDVTMIAPAPETEAPEDPDYLANASQAGAGNVSEKVRPETPEVERAPPPREARRAPSPPPVVSAEQAPRAAPEPTPEQAPAEADPSSAELIQRSMELVSLNERLHRSRTAYAQRPKQTFISARTKAYKYASYMNDWVAKVERVGNLNYPDEARRQGLSGSLLLDVALNPDGTIRNVTLMRSSGHKVLDDAATRITRLAAPFAPFPESIRKETDILHITRTWEFTSRGSLQSH